MASKKKPARGKDPAAASDTTPKVATVNIDSKELDLLRGQMQAINRSQAVAEFELDGTLISANDNFLGLMGYSLEEVRGKHHSMFVDSNYAVGAKYRGFWAKLSRGEYDSGRYKRIGREQPRSTGCRPPTTRFSMPTASHIASWNTPPTFRSRCRWRASSKCRCRKCRPPSAPRAAVI